MMLCSCKKFLCKSVPVYLFLVVVFLLSSFAGFLLYSISAHSPDISPTYLYSSGMVSKNYYEAHFNIGALEDDTFYITRMDLDGTEHTIMSGYYSQIEGNVYGLYNEEDVLIDLLTLGKNSFYFFDQSLSEIVLMQGI